MDKAAIDVAQALARLSELTIFELRGEWRRLHRMPPPMRLSRDLLIRGITYKLQACAICRTSSLAITFRIILTPPISVSEPVSEKKTFFSNVDN